MLLLKIIKKILILLDKFLFVKNLKFEQYYSLHKKLGFPIKRLNFYINNKYLLNLKNPQKFNEKVTYRHLFEKNPLLTKIVDKYEVRNYVKEKIGEKYLIPIVGIYDDIEKIDFKNLPKNFIMKTTHGSGQNIIFKDGNANISIEKVKEKFKIWQTEKYRFQELIYFVQPLKRRIIIEELLLTTKDKVPEDLKFFVFNGKIEFIQIDNDRFEEHSRNFYDKNWNLLNLKKGLDNGKIIEKPLVLDEMISIVEELGKDFTFMRVDLFLLNNKIYVGELTPAPGGGLTPFQPFENEIKYGKLWGKNLNLLRNNNE
ncbi:ATP-grasp fold amidoligase family protein [Arcobacter cloacae]|uniref:ATP-grasp fold amidoligase family protein n=1 Tax=Arcobacter cloacae TaxID=1054034 RepID=UPI0013E9421A|nr:ATP-grasp fold amidoligase family protein [Arcobacter cloacae]